MSIILDWWCHLHLTWPRLIFERLKKIDLNFVLLSKAFEVEVEGGIADLVAIREELMIATQSGRILRYSWEGQEIRDYSLDLRRIPFCVDQQVGSQLCRGRGCIAHSCFSPGSILGIPKNLFWCYWDLLTELIRGNRPEAWKCWWTHLALKIYFFGLGTFW